MNHDLLSVSPVDDAPWLWSLDDRQAATLLANDAPRWLQVASGCIWVTARVAGPAAEDIWLAAGQSLALPAGSEWVIAAWPRASMRVLMAWPAAQAPTTAPKASTRWPKASLPGWRAPWRGLRAA